MIKNRKVRALLKSLMLWPLFLVALLVIMTVYLYFIDVAAGRVATVFVLLYIAGVVVAFMIKAKHINEQLVKFGLNFGQVQKNLIKNMAIPYAVVDSEGKFLSGNYEFAGLFSDPISVNTPIEEFLPGVTKSDLPLGSEIIEAHVVIGDFRFKAEFQNMPVEADDWSKEVGTERLEHILTAIYLYDETENLFLKQELEDKKLVVGLLYIDNYEEALESIDEVRRSLLVALIDRKINKYFQNVNALLKKIEKDKFLFVFQNKYLESLKSARFTILDEVREVNIGNEMAVTVSVGIGTGVDSYTEGYDAARAAIDLALGRGGDQVVIRDHEDNQYFGGKSNSVEKSTRVKARVKAQSLRELIENKDKVYVMGHKMADEDCFGSAVGVYSICKQYGKKAYIVLENYTASVRAMVERFESNPDYNEMIISGAQAMNEIDDNSVLIVVDVNRPSITECPELLERAKFKVLIDHHRQTSDSITDAVLSYVEPYASSACEMVAEILQYISNNVKLKGLEADAMYAGIMIDTNNFLNKTGVRTYEAAAYLKRNGADVLRIRKLFRTDMNEFTIKAKAAANAERYLQNFVISHCEAEGLVESPTVLGAQVANELMDISGIKASFVLTPYNGIVYASARSNDEVNVQVIMEKLGGGGHMSVAGAQFTDCNLEEAVQRIKSVLKEMRDNGEL